MGATMLFSFWPDQFLQDLIKQANAVLVRLGPYVVVVTHSFPVREVMLNPSPCAVLFQQIQQCTNISYRSYVCGRVFFFAFSGSPRMISNCSLVMSLGYDFLIFSLPFSSIIEPVLDSEKILHRTLLTRFTRDRKIKCYTRILTPSVAVFFVTIKMRFEQF